jgi:hypothetical protein
MGTQALKRRRASATQALVQDSPLAGRGLAHTKEASTGFDFD